MKSFKQYIEVFRQPYWGKVDDFTCFKDYIGNALFGLENYLFPLVPKDYGQKIKEMFQELFDRIEVFLQHGFKEEGGLTRKNLEEMLAMKNDPWDIKLFERLKDFYKRLAITSF